MMEWKNNQSSFIATQQVWGWSGQDLSSGKGKGLGFRSLGKVKALGFKISGYLRELRSDCKDKRVISEYSQQWRVEFKVSGLGVFCDSRGGN